MGQSGTRLSMERLDLSVDCVDVGRNAPAHFTLQRYRRSTAYASGTHASSFLTMTAWFDLAAA